MKPALIVAVIHLVLSSTAAGQENKPTATKIAIDKLRAEMQAPLAELSVLSDSDKALAVSDKEQLDTSGMIEKLKRKIDTQDQPALKAKWEVLDEKRRLYVASGCPAEEAVLPPALFDRCNPQRIVLNEELERLKEESAALKKQLVMIDDTRRAVTETTLSNFAKQKANSVRRDELEAIKLAQASRLRQLYLTGILEVVKRADLKEKASAACKAMPNLEESVCCHEVVWDDRNPAQCNVPLIVTAFENAGIFGTTSVKVSGSGHR